MKLTQFGKNSSMVLPKTESQKFPSALSQTNVEEMQRSPSKQKCTQQSPTYLPQSLFQGCETPESQKSGISINLQQEQQLKESQQALYNSNPSIYTKFTNKPASEVIKSLKALQKLTSGTLLDIIKENVSELDAWASNKINEFENDDNDSRNNYYFSQNQSQEVNLSNFAKPEAEDTNEFKLSINDFTTASNLKEKLIRAAEAPKATDPEIIVQQPPSDLQIASRSHSIIAKNTDNLLELQRQQLNLLKKFRNIIKEDSPMNTSPAALGNLEEHNFLQNTPAKTMEVMHQLYKLQTYEVKEASSPRSEVTSYFRREMFKPTALGVCTCDKTTAEIQEEVKTTFSALRHGLFGWRKLIARPTENQIIAALKDFLANIADGLGKEFEEWQNTITKNIEVLVKDSRITESLIGLVNLPVDVSNETIYSKINNLMGHIARVLAVIRTKDIAQTTKDITKLLAATLASTHQENTLAYQDVHAFTNTCAKLTTVSQIKREFAKIGGSKIFDELTHGTDKVAKKLQKLTKRLDKYQLTSPNLSILKLGLGLAGLILFTIGGLGGGFIGNSLGKREAEGCGTDLEAQIADLTFINQQYKAALDGTSATLDQLAIIQPASKVLVALTQFTDIVYPDNPFYRDLYNMLLKVANRIKAGGI